MWVCLWVLLDKREGVLNVQGNAAHEHLLRPTAGPLKSIQFLAYFFIKLYNRIYMGGTATSATEISGGWSEWGNRFISAIVGIAVTVAGALIIGRFQAHEPYLVYSSTESLPFSGPSGDVSIYQVTLSNDGKKEVYDVACAIRIPLAKIDQYKVTANPLLNVSGAVSGDSLNIQIPNLNPSESIQISLLASGSQNLPARPQVTARGKGAVGSERGRENQKPWFESAPSVSLGAATFALLASTLALRLIRSKTSGSDLTGPSDDQRTNLAYVCRIYGLSDLAEEYSMRAHETTYWIEADRLGQIAVQAGGNKLELIENALQTLIEYNQQIRQTSKAIVYYNLALINRAKKDDLAFKKYLQLAKDTSPEEIERRLKFDRRFVD
jgi:hypothetical protein